MPAREIGALVATLRKKRPLVHHITNYVTVNDCANITLCIGAAPVMAHSRDEVAEMVSMAGALVLNIGTIDGEVLESMMMAGRAANHLEIPVILDPVGAGATAFRTRSSLALLKGVDIAVLKGNAGEIATLAGVEARVRGVDSMGVRGSIEKIARNLASRLGINVAVTGATDIVTDGKATLLIDNGHPLMGSFTGSGCMAASVCGAFAAVSSDHLKSTAAALCAFGVAGEMAALASEKPYSFRTAFFDAVASLTPEIVARKSKIRVGK